MHTYNTIYPLHTAPTPIRMQCLIPPNLRLTLNRQLSITPRPPRQNLQPPANIRPHNRDIPCKLPNRNQEVAEKDKQTVQLD